MTKLTREQHLAMAECLREAKKKLQTGNFFDIKPETTPLVCWAVGYTKCEKRTKYLVKGWISQQLKGEFYITDWARSRVNIDFSVFKNRQAYRHAWVDHMIKVLES
jgi:hypothetical protein